MLGKAYTIVIYATNLEKFTTETSDPANDSYFTLCLNYRFFSEFSSRVLGKINMLDGRRRP